MPTESFLHRIDAKVGRKKERGRREGKGEREKGGKRRERREK